MYWYVKLELSCIMQIVSDVRNCLFMKQLINKKGAFGAPF